MGIEVQLSKHRLPHSLSSFSSLRSMTPPLPAIVLRSLSLLQASVRLTVPVAAAGQLSHAHLPHHVDPSGAAHGGGAAAVP
eukprot:753278-Hanusia_phi.AAC.2